MDVHMYTILSFHTCANSVNETHNIFQKNIRLNHMCFIKEKENPIGGLHMTLPKHDYANYDRFVPSFNMVYKTIKRVSVPILKSFRPMKTELWAKKLENFLFCYMGKWAGASCPPTWLLQYKCMEIFETLTVTFAFIGVST